MYITWMKMKYVTLCEPSYYPATSPFSKFKKTTKIGQDAKAWMARNCGEEDTRVWKKSLKSTDLSRLVTETQLGWQQSTIFNQHSVGFFGANVHGETDAFFTCFLPRIDPLSKHRCRFPVQGCLLTTMDWSKYGPWPRFQMSCLSCPTKPNPGWFLGTIDHTIRDTIWLWLTVCHGKDPPCY